MGYEQALHSHRKIIHVDMDAFFAAIEQRDHPRLRGKPIAVGHDGPRGVVATASYEARRFGVHSAQSVALAKQLCPELIVVPGRFEVYKSVSAQIQEIFGEYTDLIEPLSLDEAFLDVTRNKKDMPWAMDIAAEIKEKIRAQLMLTASAGVSYNKFLAKIASDYRKPDGLCVIHPKKALDFIAQLDIRRFWGVGPGTAARFHKMGVFTGRDLREMSLSLLNHLFGKRGQVFYDFARGIDDREVEPNYIRKSVGCENTFAEDISRKSSIIIELYHTVLQLEERIQKDHFTGYTLTLKIKFSDFSQITRSITQARPLTDKDVILPLAKQLMKKVEYDEKPIRLIGLSVSGAHKEDTEPLWLDGFKYDEFDKDIRL